MPPSRDVLITIVFIVAFVVAGVLTFTGKALPLEAFGPVFAGFIGWIMAQPQFAKSEERKRLEAVAGPIISKATAQAKAAAEMMEGPWCEVVTDAKKPPPPRSPPLTAIVFALAFGSDMTSSSAGCTPAERHDTVNTVLNVAQTACVIYEAEAGNSRVEEIVTVCQIQSALADLVRQLIDGARLAQARRRAERARNPYDAALDERR